MITGPGAVDKELMDRKTAELLQKRYGGKYHFEVIERD